MYGCESWTIKKADCWRIDAFKLWCWRRLLRVPSSARRSNQSVSPGCSFEGLMLKLKLQYFGHLMRRFNSLERTLMLGVIGGRRRGRQRMRWLDGITNQWTWVWVNFGSWWWTGRPGVLRCMGSQRVGHDWATELNWTFLATKARERKRTRWWRSRWTRSTSLSTDTSVIYLQTQKCMQNTSWEWKGVPDQWKRIYKTTQNSVGQRN